MYGTFLSIWQWVRWQDKLSFWEKQRATQNNEKIDSDEVEGHTMMSMISTGTNMGIIPITEADYGCTAVTLISANRARFFYAANHAMTQQ